MESFFPRSYDLNDHEEVCAFVEDYCVVQSMGVLKRYLCDGDGMEGPRGRPIQCRGGYRRLVGLAMRVCEGYHSKCTVSFWPSAFRVLSLNGLVVVGILYMEAAETVCVSRRHFKPGW